MKVALSASLRRHYPDQVRGVPAGSQCVTHTPSPTRLYDQAAEIVKNAHAARGAGRGPEITRGSQARVDAWDNLVYKYAQALQ